MDVRLRDGAAWVGVRTFTRGAKHEHWLIVTMLLQDGVEPVVEGLGENEVVRVPAAWSAVYEP